jgi:hypothetical protein
MSAFCYETKTSKQLQEILMLISVASFQSSRRFSGWKRYVVYATRSTSKPREKKRMSSLFGRLVILLKEKVCTDYFMLQNTTRKQNMTCRIPLLPPPCSPRPVSFSKQNSIHSMSVTPPRDQHGLSNLTLLGVMSFPLSASFCV